MMEFFEKKTQENCSSKYYNAEYRSFLGPLFWLGCHSTILNNLESTLSKDVCYEISHNVALQSFG